MPESQADPIPALLAQPAPASPPPPRRVVVLIVAWNSRADLEECLTSVYASKDPALRTEVVLVDNASSDDSGPLVRRLFPQVQVLRLERNTGFAGGNNAGWEFAQRMWPDLEFLTLLNPDTRVGEGWLSALAGALDAQLRAAAAQPLLLLHDRPDRLNTLGNRSHFLGFGHVSHLGEAADPLPSPVPAMQFPSGAAVMLRAAAVRGLGLFDERFFLYLEDADLGWKLRQAGHELILAPAARVWHKYRGDAPLRAYELLERNRWILLLTYYRLRTLLLLAPALAAMELGQCLFSLLRGVAGQKLRAWGWLLSAESLGHVLRRRREAQRNRRLSDRAFLADFTGRIDFPGLRSPLLRWVANPLFATYWAVARRLILW